MQTHLPCIRIIEDESALRQFLVLLIHSHGFSCRAYDSAERFISNDNLAEPGCVLADLNLPGLNGAELVDWIGTQLDPLPTIILTGFGSIRAAVQCLKNGVIGFLEKPVDSLVLLDLVREAVELDTVNRTARHNHSVIESRYSKLSAREHEVFAYLAQGLHSKQIANRMELSSKTVEKHRSNVMKKMEADSIAELVRAAIELRI